MSAAQRVRRNCAVYITYEIRDLAGDILERSDLAVGYVHGADSSELLPKVEASLEGARVGDSVSVRVSPEEGFGPHRPELAFGGLPARDGGEPFGDYS